MFKEEASNNLKKFYLIKFNQLINYDRPWPEGLRLTNHPNISQGIKAKKVEILHNIQEDQHSNKDANQSK